MNLNVESLNEFSKSAVGFAGVLLGTLFTFFGIKYRVSGLEKNLKETKDDIKGLKERVIYRDMHNQCTKHQAERHESILKICQEIKDDLKEAKKDIKEALKIRG